MRYSLLPALAALAIVSTAARADQFTLTLGPYGSTPVPALPQATITARNNGNGTYSIQSIDGPGFSLLPVNTSPFENDNLISPFLFLPGTYVADNDGFAFNVAVDGMVDEFDAIGAGPPYGQRVSLLTPGTSTPVDFAYTYSITPGAAPVNSGSSVTPEPSSFVLLGTGLLGMAGLLRRRLA